MIPGTRRDEVLALRKFVTDRRAMGDSTPLLRQEHLDWAISHCGLVLDTDQIPEDHEFLGYYTRRRIDRLAEAALTIQDPSHPRSALLAALMKVLAAPASVAALTPFLEHDELSVNLYALWRLERLVCGSSRHLADGTLRKAFGLLLDDPEALMRQRGSFRCAVIRDGIFPPPAWVSQLARSGR
ncbi:MAG: hypothetical protein HY815_10220 [Candidatus Riflebacteria bacterium]|nr:hypothetical protein [Candidatus Riflebacteria bacterium]